MTNYQIIFFWTVTKRGWLYYSGLCCSAARIIPALNQDFLFLFCHVTVNTTVPSRQRLCLMILCQRLPPNLGQRVIRWGWCSDHPPSGLQTDALRCPSWWHGDSGNTDTQCSPSGRPQASASVFCLNSRPWTKLSALAVVHVSALTVRRRAWSRQNGS